MSKIIVEIERRDAIMSGMVAQNLIRKYQTRDIRKDYEVYSPNLCNKMYCVSGSCALCAKWFIEEIYKETNTLIVELI